ncbi:helix-turn-helix transcriptional regulator [Paractinoplanes toevensis]|uniref:Helix-turn-helix transcriptional regulator n=1 Tax=Paractinoplanes toevensis TaxID=571911 RepID=A0A919W6J8_9ACTN|nr:response regulator transcription factor [Actinoplanes toevensis]GIM94790.1 helix-turn-helix transcriptional regulator [Actinoplanes toevensis]
MKHVRVAVAASGPINEAGIVSHLTSRPDLQVLPNETSHDADVLVIETEQLSADITATLRRWAADTGVPVVLVIGDIDDGELLTVTRYGVLAILPKRALTAEQLTQSVRTVAQGGGMMPPSLVGGLVRHLEKFQREVLAPSGLHAAGFLQREVDVLRLMADGFDTNEIASKLYCSERTVKNIFSRMSQRLNLRSRSHAVAYALRTGVI